ncbi:hypothetical protein BDN70DRAFT_884988 [Pholiota conissans]|uniref:BBC1/AIM3 cysteine proteinase-fold domain-containing protein n=1 Tax=Pholiota conissans TaxID=109636 RepID=A0A9P6CUX6_9AGAR|nr:hypothetical protein BDN70DRAFT_884988 [Pholiota conissans]
MNQDLYSVDEEASLLRLPPLPGRIGFAAISTAASSTSSSSRTSPLPSTSSAIPPPPPPQKLTAAMPHSLISPSHEPPPVVGSTQPCSNSPREILTEPEQINWTNLTPEDKGVFFSWLDEFFVNFTPPTSIRSAAVGSLGSSSQSHGLPNLSGTSRLGIPTSSGPAGNQSTPFIFSHPLPTTYGSGALDLAHYFAPTTPWLTAWYNPAEGPSIPPPLVGDTNHTYTSSWISRGPNKITHIGICFSDLSLFWGTVAFSITGVDSSIVHRHAVFLPPPRALGWRDLLNAHETYGNTVALYAESFLGSGQYCARGECWDLATEALKYFLDFDYVPIPVPSISRTHGHLIFEGMATNSGQTMVGRWRGGDNRIRRGDIAEWRKVKLRMKDAPPGNCFTLGDPDHTSIIVTDCIPNAAPMDGQSMLPTNLGVLVVVEQSIDQPPARKEYDLRYFEEGEMWIYRPIGMQVYLGVSALTAEPPPGLRGLQHLRMRYY